MSLTIDANEIFSAIIAKGRDEKTKKLDILFSEKVKLYAPSKLFEEVEKEKNAIKLMKLSGFSESEFNLFVELLKLRIHLVQTNEFSEKLAQAKSLSPHDKDLPYFALALKMECPIWSGEKKFTNQQEIKVYNTKDLIDNFQL